MEGQKIEVLMIKQLIKVKNLNLWIANVDLVFQQVISDPTHIFESSSSWRDLIFMSQPNLIINSGVHFLLHPNCHHHIIHNIHNNIYLLVILVKKADLFNSFLQNSAQSLKKVVFPLHQVIPLPISTCQILNSQRMILKESSVKSILTKHMLITWSVFACWKCPSTLQLNLFSQYLKTA